MGVWLVGVATATSVAWGAVQVVGDSVADRSLTSQPARDVEGSAAATLAPRPSGSVSVPSPSARSRPASALPRSSPTTRVRPTTVPTRPAPTRVPTSPQAPRAATRTATFSAIGGTVAVSCTGFTATMRYASPVSGFTSEVESGGPEEVKVRFRSADHESKIRVGCVNGSPDARVEEHSEGGEG